MNTYQVIVEVTTLATYKVQAESEREARQAGVDMAYDGMGIGGWDIQSADVYDVTDETEEG